MAAKKVDYYKIFDSAIQNFWKGKYEAAKEAFSKIATAENADGKLKDSASSHIIACAKKLDNQETEPKTAEDFYSRAVVALNNGNSEESITLLKDAINKDKANDAYVFTLANAYVIKGDDEAALTELQRAIAINPDNLIYAQNNRDFKVLAEESELLTDFLSTES